MVLFVLFYLCCLVSVFTWPMAGKRGTGRGRASQPRVDDVAGLPPAPGVSDRRDAGSLAQVDENAFPCGTCNTEIGNEDSLECELCSTWTHASQECSGLPYKVFKNIVDFSKHGVTYVCTSCRLRRDKGGSKTTGELTQLFETVKGLSSAVAKLSVEIRELKSHGNIRGAGPSTGPQHSVDPAVLQKWVREDTRELLERDKRKDSIIIRGISSNNIQTSFTEIAKFLCPNLNIILFFPILSPLRPILFAPKS